MQQGNIFFARSDPATHFRGACAQNAGITEDIVLPGAIGGSGIARSVAKVIAIESIQNLDWEIWLFANKLFRTGNVATERVLGWWTFVAGDAKTVGATGLFSYSNVANDIPYEDLDSIGAPGAPGKLHMMVVNRSAGAKLAGDAGAIRIDLGLMPTQGF